jgi:hypothetical protein
MNAIYDKKLALRGYRSRFKKASNLLQTHCGFDSEVYKASQACDELERFVADQLQQAFEAGRQSSTGGPL